jgi:TonB dependent receptor
MSDHLIQYLMLIVQFFGLTTALFILGSLKRSWNTRRTRELNPSLHSRRHPSPRVNAQQAMPHPACRRREFHTRSPWAEVELLYGRRSHREVNPGDLVEGNSLLLPNRNLDSSYAKLDLGGSYQFMSWVAAYAQLDNLTGNKRIAPIGYPSLPFTFRVGLRFTIGHSK